MRASVAAVRTWQPSYPLLLALAAGLQILLLLRAFGSVLFNPGQFLLSNAYDGAKNYYTFQAYVQQPWENGLSWFGMMNYPYGDYIFYTDNTPLLAVPVRLWSHYISDLGPHALDVFNALVIVGPLVSTVLLVAILRRFVRHWGLIVVFAVALPWLNPQLNRLFVGHFNLAYSWVLLLGIWGLLNIYERAQAGRPLLGWTIGLTLAFTLTSFIHLYYLLVLALLTGGFFACWLLPRHPWLAAPRLAATAAALTVGPLALTMLIIRVVDKYYTLRKATAGNFEFEPWKLQVSALIRAPDQNKIDFWLQPRDFPSYESNAYLGAFVLFGATVLAAAALLSPRFRRAAWRSWQANPGWPFLRVLLGAAVISLLVSVGTVYRLDDGNYVITNYLNIFYYLQKVVPSITQFRVAARFSWVFFWAVNFIGIVGLDWWLRRNRQPARWLLAAGLLVLVLVDTRDAVKYYSGRQPNLLSNSRYMAEINALLWNVQPEKYQAFLPVPYFHIGTEELDITMDDYNDHSMHAYQLGLRTNLPMLASKMSRTPPEHLRELRTLFTPDGPSPALRARLKANGKPLLVLYDKSYYDGTNRVIEQLDRPAAREILDAGVDLPARQHLKLLAQHGSLYLYQWDL